MQNGLKVKNIDKIIEAIKLALKSYKTYLH